MKSNTLEWVLTSPPKLHTFAIAPKIITTNKEYLSYRNGSYVNKEIVFSKIENYTHLNNSQKEFMNYFDDIEKDVTLELNVFLNPKIINNITIK